MSITFTPDLRHCPEGQDHGLNLSQGNATNVLRILGFDGEDLAYGESAPDLFLGRVLLAEALADLDPGQAGRQDGQWHEGARAPGYLQARLAELRGLAEDCLARLCPITWG